MQGINKIKHEHLNDALLQLESLLKKENNQNNKSLQQAADYRNELESLYKNYERSLEDLAAQITAYEALFSYVKVQYLGKKLKELKKEISEQEPAFLALVQNIHLIYGT